MDNPRRRRFRALLEAAPWRGDRKAFMERTGLSKGRLSQLLDDDEPFGEVAARRLAEKLDLPLDYFDRDQSHAHLAVNERQAHYMSPIASKLPPIISWEEATMDTESLPEEFRLSMPDGALASTPQGTILYFSRTTNPTPGRGVLVVDAAGFVYVRRYVQLPGGQWSAEATTPGYASLDSAADELRVLGTAIGRMDGSV